MRASAEGAIAKWHPSLDSGIAFATVAGMILSYIAIGRSAGDLALVVVIITFIIPLLTVAIPVYWVLMVKKEPASSLGLTFDRWLPALLLGLLMAAFEMVPILIGKPITMSELLPAAMAGAVSLWEPLFIFGWLQSRFEKDYGILPGILLAAACFGLYHVGFGSVNMVTGQFLSALLFAVVFRMVNNILAVWPVLWATSCVYYSAAGGFGFFGWDQATYMAMLFLLEAAFIVIVTYLSRKNRPGKTTVPT